MLVPALVHAVYVRPNEISIERPYIERHIEATTAGVRTQSQRHGSPVYAHPGRA